jgi:hypothetical protein
MPGGPMEELIQNMVETVGIDRATADKVIEVLKDHSHKLGGIF